MEKLLAHRPARRASPPPPPRSRNHLTGTIPAALGTQARMNQLKLHGNKKIVGTLPPELADLRLLEVRGSALGGEPHGGGRCAPAVRPRPPLDS